MEIIYERVAAIDVDKKIIAVAVRTMGEHPGKRRVQVRKYNTYTPSSKILPPQASGPQAGYHGAGCSFGEFMAN